MDETIARIGALGLLVGHSLLALSVTIHVLLQKRDVGAAIGWIGLAWLSPILGSVLYVLFGINRVRQRANQLRENPPAPRMAKPPIAPVAREDYLAPLERAGDHITRRAAESGNAASVLHNGDEAYPRMIAAIEAAKVSVALSSYIFRADAAGIRFIDQLVAAHGRGVRVRVLIDGVGGGYFLSSSYERLRRQSVAVARFMHSPLPWRMPFLNLRNHKKILLVDGSVAFTGGLNIGGENLLACNPRHPVRDIHFEVKGPVVAQIVEAFAADWFFASGETLAGDAWFPSLSSVGEAAARVVVSGPDLDVEKVELMILEAIACARHSIKISTPYFLPDDGLVTALALAAIRGVGVDVIVPGHGNHPIVDWAMRAQIGPLVAAGCRLWRSPPPFDHSKMLTIDGVWCLIGSPNWDVRSLRLNFELALEIYHADIARRLDAMMDGRRGALITTAELDALPLPVKLIDGAARLLLPYL